MISVRQIAARQLFSRNVYNLGFGSKRKATPGDLDKYDVVVVGAGLGNVLATHLDAVVGEKAKIYVAYDNPVTSFHSERNLYETGKYFSLIQHHQIQFRNTYQTNSLQKQRSIRLCRSLEDQSQQEWSHSEKWKSY